MYIIITFSHGEKEISKNYQIENPNFLPNLLVIFTKSFVNFCKKRLPRLFCKKSRKKYQKVWYKSGVVRSAFRLLDSFVKITKLLVIFTNFFLFMHGLQSYH